MRGKVSVTSGITEVEIGGRPFTLRPVSRDVLNMPNVMAAGIAASLGKPYGWGVGFMFGNLELAMGLWITISSISGFDGD